MTPENLYQEMIHSYMSPMWGGGVDGGVPMSHVDHKKG